MVCINWTLKSMAFVYNILYDQVIKLHHNWVVERHNHTIILLVIVLKIFFVYKIKKLLTNDLKYKTNFK